MSRRKKTKSKKQVKAEIENKRQEKQFYFWVGIITLLFLLFVWFFMWRNA